MSFTARIPNDSAPGATRRNAAVLFDDHFATTVAWATTTASGGAVLQSGAAVSDKSLGVMTLSTGATSTGRIALLSHVDGLWFGSTRYTFESRAALLNLSDATNTYTVRFGFMDSATGDSTDGHYFRYSHGANSGRWECVTRNNGVEVLTQTTKTAGVLSSGEPFTVFRIEVASSGTRIVFSIDGSTVATHSAGPTGSARATGMGYSIIKSAGTTLRQLAVDYTYFVGNIQGER
jgi:hypothetical protein